MADMEPPQVRHDRSLVALQTKELSASTASRGRILGDMVEGSLELLRREIAHDVFRLPIPCAVRIHDEFWGQMLLQPDGCAGFIDETGKIVIAKQWNSAWVFREELAAFSQENKWGFMDPYGQIVILPRWDAVRHFHEGVAWVMKGTRWGVIDASGKVTSQPQWDRLIGDSSEHLLCVSRGGKRGFINGMGETIIEPQWNDADLFREKLAFVIGKGKRGFIDRTGEMIIRLTDKVRVRPLIRQFSEGFVCVQHENEFGFMSRSGQIEIRTEWDDAQNFSGGLAVVARNRKPSKGADCLDADYGFINRTGETVVPPQWDFARSFSEGYGLVQKDFHMDCVLRFINERGEVIIELERGDYAENFVAGMACVQRTMKWGLIGRDGKTKMPMVWDSIDMERVGRNRSAYRLALRKITPESALAVWLDPDLNEIWQRELPLVRENLPIGRFRNAFGPNPKLAGHL
jgi:hypothetical protein